MPCYNEEQVLAETSKRLKEKCEMLIHDGKIAKENCDLLLTVTHSPFIFENEFDYDAKEIRRYIAMYK